jgi:Sec-independent protein translocase protein TatA
MMEILGVGTPELIAILLIMLIVAGPKRMIQWAYTLGQYTARLRKMWAEMMTYMEKEMAAAGMDVDLPREIPTRGTVMREINKIGEKAMSPVTKPIEDTLKEANNQVKDIKAQTTLPKENGNKVSQSSDAPPPSDGKPDLGSWSGAPKVDS